MILGFFYISWLFGNKHQQNDMDMIWSDIFTIISVFFAFD